MRSSGSRRSPARNSLSSSSGGCAEVVALDGSSWGRETRARTALSMSRVAEEIPAGRSLAAASGQAVARLTDPGYLLRFATVTALYVGAAKVGLGLSVAHGVITPVWAPSGIALAALIILGPRYWPAVALGAFVANATSDVSIWIAAAIAVGNTLEAVAGAFLLRRARFRTSL